MTTTTVKSALLTSVLLLLLTTPAIYQIFLPGYYPMHDDLQVMRQLEMKKCWEDRQIPCRWVTDMGYGYGYPLFNFYPPMPYYLGQIFVLLGLGLIPTIKIVFALGFIVSAFGMYSLVNRIWGKNSALVASIFYVYAPYHATDIYVRGAMNEFWALAWYPYILLGIYQVIHTRRKRDIILLSFTTAMLMLSHNPMLMIFTPFALIWTIFWLIQTRSHRAFFPLFISGIWALGLAAFFTLPVIFEQKFAHVETLIIGYFNYLAHFTDINQLFFRMNWGFGESILGPGDTMSFNIGYLHWILWGLVTLLSLVGYSRHKNTSRLVLCFSVITLGFTFMTHSRSTEVWKILKPLEFLQFPWRLLTVIIFGASFLASSIFQFVNRKYHTLLSFCLILGVILLNFQFFKWRDHWPWVDEEHKLSGELWKLQTTAGIFDYLPIWAKLPPAGAPHGDSEIITGHATTTTIQKRSNYQKYQLEVYSGQAKWQLNTFYFPGWRYYLDGKEVIIDPRTDLDQEIGRPQIDITQGSHTLEAKLKSTPIQNLGNLFSLLSWGVLAFSIANVFQNRNSS